MSFRAQPRNLRGYCSLWASFLLTGSRRGRFQTCPLAADPYPDASSAAFFTVPTTSRPPTSSSGRRTSRGSSTISRTRSSSESASLSSPSFLTDGLRQENMSPGESSPSSPRISASSNGSLKKSRSSDLHSLLRKQRFHLLAGASTRPGVHLHRCRLLCPLGCVRSPFSRSVGEG